MLAQFKVKLLCTIHFAYPHNHGPKASTAKKQLQLSSVKGLQCCAFETGKNFKFSNCWQQLKSDSLPDRSHIFLRIKTQQPNTVTQQLTRVTQESIGAFLKSATTSDCVIPSTETPFTSRRRSPGFKVPSSMAAPGEERFEFNYCSQQRRDTTRIENLRQSGQNRVMLHPNLGIMIG